MGSPEKNNHVQKKVIFYCSELFIFFSSVLVFKISVVVTFFFFCRGIYKMSNLSEGHPLATAPRSQRYVIVKIQPGCYDDFNEIFLGRILQLP